jgi:hypothetical protein
MQEQAVILREARRETFLVILRGAKREALLSSCAMRRGKFFVILRGAKRRRRIQMSG